MKVVKGSCHLIENEFAMFFSENVFPDQGIEVNVQVLKNQVNSAIILCSNDLLEMNDVRVGK